MDILKDRSQKSYEYLSRYSSFPYYYNTQDKKYMYGLTSNLSTDTAYVTVAVDFTTTLDGLANKYYGRPDYFWVIADFNRIQDPFINLSEYFKTIKIPSISTIEYLEES